MTTKLERLEVNIGATEVALAFGELAEIDLAAPPRSESQEPGTPSTSSG